MGDILKKLQMVCEKIGVTETAHTIEEQVDLISESLDKIPASTNIAEALDDLSEVAQNINNEEVYIDKTITANGEYLPAQDEATAYSKVTVNVQPSSLFYIGRTEGEWDGLRYRYGRGFLTMNPNDDGVVSCGDSDVTKLYIQYIIVENPVKTIKSGTSSGVYFYFTPTDDFTGFYREGTDVAITTVGDTVTPGDGKCYSYEVKGMGSPVVTKYDYDFSFELSPSST